jgi:hypothetical protein
MAIQFTELVIYHSLGRLISLCDILTPVHHGQVTEGFACGVYESS